MKGTLKCFSKRKKNLNLILDSSKSSTCKQGLGFDPYARSKTNAPTIVRALGCGKFETLAESEPNKVVFKSPRFLSSIMNTNVASSSKSIHRVKYTCTHCGRDGHLVDFCFRLAKQQKKEKSKARSNLRNARFIPHEVVAPHFVPQVKQL